MANPNILFFVMIFNVAIAWAAPSVGNQQAGSEVKPRFFFNDDGDRGIMQVRGPFTIRQLYYPVDNLLGTGVTTLVYCANLGSDQAYYPSKVASSLDWRMTESHRPENPIPVFPRVYQVGRMVREQGIDILGTVMQYAQEKGLEFVPSLRMNDGHFGNNLHPSVHPLTGEFWMKHQDMTIGPIDPALGDFQDFCQYLLNFEHKAVREYRMGQIYELIDGYAADGFEMDFTRHYMFFPPGREKPELITEMVRKTHQRLAEKNQKDGKQRFLIVRVADTLPRCQQIGLDVPRWIRDGLVDYVVPSSPNRNFQFDIALEDFLALAKGTAVWIVASPDSYGADGVMYRGGMSNYYAMGQRDMYLFNFFTRHYPYNDEDFALLRDLKSPDTLWGRPKDFHALEFFPNGNLKLEEADRAYPVRMYIGDDLSACGQAGILKFAKLHFECDNLHSGDRFEIALNGQPLAGQSIRTDEKGLHLELRNGPLPVVGWNTLTVTPKSFGSESRPALTRVYLKIDYDISGGGYKVFVPEPFLRKERIKLLETGKPYSVELRVDEDLAACREAKILRSAQLLIQIKYRHPEDQYEFYLNGTSLPVPPVGEDGMSYRIELKNSPLLQVCNTVAVKVRSFGSETRPYIRRIHLQTDYNLSSSDFNASKL